VKFHPNGEPNTMIARYNGIEITVIAAILSLLCSAIIGNVLMYREIGAITERQRALDSKLDIALSAFASHTALPFHSGVYRDFLTKEEFQRYLDAQKERNRP
jgi:hypothetical protein